MQREILVCVDGTQAGAGPVPQALALAKACRARLTIAVLTAEPDLHVTSFAGVDAVAQTRMVEELRAATSETLKSVQAPIADTPVPTTLEVESGGVSQLAAWVQARARTADLMVIGAVESFSDPWYWTRLVEGALFGSGRPVAVIPVGAEPSAWSHAALGWNASREATRAFHDALPWLSAGARLDIILFEPEANDAGAEIAQAGDRLGFHTALHPLPLPIEPMGEALQAFAIGRAADVLIVGAYGRSRFREFLLGGVTRDVLGHTRLPVLLSH
jgi:nucleotide-binding universal stress UspA family protein